MAEEVKKLITARDAFVAEYALVLRPASAALTESIDKMCVLVAPYLTQEGCKIALGKHADEKIAEEVKKYTALVMVISGVLKVAHEKEQKDRHNVVYKAVGMFCQMPEKKKTKLAGLVEEYITASNTALAHLHLFGLHDSDVFIRPKGIGKFDDKWFIVYDTFGMDSSIVERPYFFKTILCASFQKVYDPDNNALPPDLHIKCMSKPYGALKFRDFDVA